MLKEYSLFCREINSQENFSVSIRFTVSCYFYHSNLLKLIVQYSVTTNAHKLNILENNFFFQGF